MSSPDRLPDDVRRWIDQQADDERPALARTWDLAGLADEPALADDATDAAWSRLAAALDDPTDDAALDDDAQDAVSSDAVQRGLRAWQERGRPTLIPAQAAPLSQLARRPSAWAGALALALVAVVVWTRPVTVEAGDVGTVSLPDGSRVTLATGSELVYRRGLRGDDRRVTLTGQGYFDVERDGRPFVVETATARVEVLGTEFDVQAWPSATPETAVALVEGSVRLATPAGSVVLEPGQASRTSGGPPTPPAATDVEAVAAWRDGAFSVVDAPLGSVAAALEARFGRPVRLGPGVDARRRLTLFLPSADSADVVLRDLAAYLDLRVQAGPDRYDVLPR